MWLFDYIFYAVYIYRKRWYILLHYHFFLLLVPLCSSCLSCFFFSSSFYFFYFFIFFWFFLVLGSKRKNEKVTKSKEGRKKLLNEYERKDFLSVLTLDLFVYLFLVWRLFLFLGDLLVVEYIAHTSSAARLEGLARNGRKGTRRTRTRCRPRRRYL